MAWNRHFIFVTTPVLTKLPVILSLLGLGMYSPVKEVSFMETNKPTTLFAGFCHGNLLLVDPNLPDEFFSDTITATEKKFIAAFPNSEITVAVVNETVGLFQYAIIKHGKKVRMKDGCDGVIYHDQGGSVAGRKGNFTEEDIRT